MDLPWDKLWLLVSYFTIDGFCTCVHLKVCSMCSVKPQGLQLAKRKKKFSQGLQALCKFVLNEGMVQICSYCALQVSCPGIVREWHLSLLLYKVKAFVTCSMTELSHLRATAYLSFPLDNWLAKHCRCFMWESWPINCCTPITILTETAAAPSCTNYPRRKD